MPAEISAGHSRVQVVQSEGGGVGVVTAPPMTYGAFLDVVEAAKLLAQPPPSLPSPVSTQCRKSRGLHPVLRRQAGDSTPTPTTEAYRGPGCRADARTTSRSACFTNCSGCKAWRSPTSLEPHNKPSDPQHRFEYAFEILSSCTRPVSRLLGATGHSSTVLGSPDSLNGPRAPTKRTLRTPPCGWTWPKSGPN